MLIQFTDKMTGNPVAINPKQVLCVVTHKNEELNEEVTVIGIPSATIGVTQSYTEVVGLLNGAMAHV
jgi:hypothetical protein